MWIEIDLVDYKNARTYTRNKEKKEYSMDHISSRDVQPWVVVKLSHGYYRAPVFFAGMKTIN